MNIDEGVLSEVMEVTGEESKTGAVEAALREVARKFRLKKLLRAGLGLSSDEIKASYDFEAYDRLSEMSGGMVLAEKPVKYGSKSRSRR